MADKKELTLDNIELLLTKILDSRITQSEQKTDLQFIKVEKSINELKADNKRHDNRFEMLDGRVLQIVGTIKENVGLIKERLNRIEEILEMERAEDNAANKKDIEHLQKQIDAINEKLKAG